MRFECKRVYCEMPVAVCEDFYGNLDGVSSREAKRQEAWIRNNVALIKVGLAYYTAKLIFLIVLLLLVCIGVVGFFISILKS